MQKPPKGGFFNDITWEPEVLAAQGWLNPGAMSDLGFELTLQRFFEPGAGELASEAVSYTHLTLPTILRV